MHASLQWALYYAAQNLPVFPVWPIVDGICLCKSQHNPPKHCAPGKHPITPKGVLDASLDATQIRSWWDAVPNADLNVGIALPDGVLVVDIDPRNKGEDTYSQILSDPELGLCSTLAARTGGGGLHLFYRVPEGLTFPKNLDDDIGPGVDLKGFGGYVLAVPSSHASGGVYTWATAPDDPIADAPAWLVALGRPRGARAGLEDEGAVFEDDIDETLATNIETLVETLAPYFEQGVRHHLSFALGGYLKNRGYSKADAQSLVGDLASTAGSADPTQRAKDAGGAWRYKQPKGYKALRELLPPAALTELERLIPDKKPRGVPEVRAAIERMQARVPVFVEPDEKLPLIVHVQGSCWLKARDTDDYDYKAARIDLRSAVAERFPEIVLYREKKDGDGGALVSTEELLVKYSRLIRSVGVRYAQTETSFNRDTSTLTRGLRCPVIAPRYDARVDLLLTTMVGADARPDLYDWIAACRQDLLDKPAAILALVGPPGICKTFLFTVLAEMQGKPKPVPLKTLTKQFQSELAECSMLLADEEMPKEITQAELSEIVQSGARLIEHKGVDEKVAVKGCFRVGAAANAIERLKLNGSAGPDALRALADRFAVFLIPSGRREAILAVQSALRVPGSERLDVEAFKGHFSWIQTTVVPRAQRFLGARQDPTLARTAVARIDAAKHIDLFDAIQMYLEGIGADDAGYRAMPFEKEADALERRKMAWASYPIFVRGGAVCVRPSALAVALGLKAEAVRDALKPMQLDGRVQIRCEEDVVKGYALDTKALFAAMTDLDLDAAARTLAVDTADRRRVITAAIPGVS